MNLDDATIAARLTPCWRHSSGWAARGRESSSSAANPPRASRDYALTARSATVSPRSMMSIPSRRSFSVMQSGGLVKK